MDEATIEALAPSPDVFAAGVLLFLNGAITVQLRTDDATLIFGACAGSGALPYEVSADLRAAVPVLRCSCPSRKRPCKHALALLVAHARQHAVFVVAEVPRDLVEKLAKDDAKAAATQPASRAKKRKAPNKEAQAKKAQAQLEGLEMASRVLNDLAMSGLGAVDEDRIVALRVRATEIADFHLPGVALCLRRLALVVEDAEVDPAAKGAIGARRLAQLWAMIKKGRVLLASKLEEGAATENEADALVDELLGKVWQLEELRERGYVRTNLTLVELAYARVDDPARDERIETSFLADVESGEILRDVSYTPARRVGKEPPKVSFAGAIEVGEAGIYPGFVNRRIRWDDDGLVARSLTVAEREALIGRASSVADACAKLQDQLKNLLAPEDAVFLLQVAKVGRVREEGVMEDAAGARLPFANAPSSSAAAFRALELSGWPAGGRALLARLAVDEARGGIVAHPMTVLGPHGAVRLSV